MSECLYIWIQISTKKVFRVVKLVLVDFKPGLYRWRKCPKRVKTTAASLNSVEQLNLSLHDS